jgi:HlyD family secretion protein
MTITAPIDGTVGNLQTQVGAVVGTTTLMTIVPSNTEVVVNVQENDVGQIAVGQSAQLSVTAYPNQLFDASVIAINPSLDTTTRTAAVHISPNTQDGALRVGMSATVTIHTARADDAVVVPVASVQQKSGSQFVWTDSDGIATMQTVQTGLATASVVQITSGVQPGQQVILPGSTTLTAGQAVVAASSDNPSTATAMVASGS